MTADRFLRRVVLAVLLLNLGYFLIEFSVALDIQSVSLFADSIDFLEDASVNLLVLLAFGWSVRRRGNLGVVLACLLLAPALATMWAIWQKFGVPQIPAAMPLTSTGAGALVVNVVCAFMLAQARHAGSVLRAAFLSARNDAIANVAILLAGAATAWMPSIWPDLVVGIGIALINLGAAREVYVMARAERRTPTPEGILKLAINAHVP